MCVCVCVCVCVWSFFHSRARTRTPLILLVRISSVPPLPSPSRPSLLPLTGVWCLSASLSLSLSLSLPYPPPSLPSRHIGIGSCFVHPCCSVRVSWGTHTSASDHGFCFSLCGGADKMTGRYLATSPLRHISVVARDDRSFSDRRGHRRKSMVVVNGT
jgi:hypothetical protein